MSDNKPRIIIGKIGRTPPNHGDLHDVAPDPAPPGGPAPTPPAQTSRRALRQPAQAAGGGEIMVAEVEELPLRPRPVRGSVAFGLLALAVLLIGIGIWAGTANISGAVMAPGRIEVEHAQQIVQHPDGGVVSEILVTSGQSVAQGDTLLRLDDSLIATELSIVEGQYYETLARHARLEAERADLPEITFPDELDEAGTRAEALREGQRSLFNARAETVEKSIDQLDQQATQIRAQLVGIESQQAALERQATLIAEELTDQQKLLDRGLTQAPRVMALEREKAALDGRIGEMKAQHAQSKTREAEIRIQQLRLGAERRETAEAELRDLGYREVELAERRRALREKLARLDIRAPVSGVVHQLAVTTPRAVIRPAEPILFLIPQDRPLIISAPIPPANVDEVRAGMDVRLRFSAFSARTTPELSGSVARVSPDIFTDERLGTQYYRAEISITADERQRLGDLELVPGMPVEVYIQTGSRTALSYLVKPLSDYFYRAFREG